MIMARPTHFRLTRTVPGRGSTMDATRRSSAVGSAQATVES
jgi:hypothetical protein